MLDYSKYTTKDYGYQGNGNGYHGNGYDKLDGDYALFYKVGKNFTRKVKPEDSQDFLHDLFLVFARVKASYESKGKELTTGGLVRIAQYELSDYWRKWYHRNQNHDCGRCSKRQKQKCQQDDLYGSKCPKAIQLESLDRLIEYGNGDSTRLCELIADDNAIDLIARLDARQILKGYPRRFVQLMYKDHAGYPLTNTERNYIYHHKKKAQKQLITV